MRNEYWSGTEWILFSTIVNWYGSICSYFTEVPDTAPETIEIKTEPTDIPEQFKKNNSDRIFLLEYNIKLWNWRKVILQYSQNLLSENESGWIIKRYVEKSPSITAKVC